MLIKFTLMERLELSKVMMKRPEEEERKKVKRIRMNLEKMGLWFY